MVFVCRAEARAWSGGTTVLVLVLLLSGCMAFWETPQGTARLMVGDVVVTGTESSALVSVVNMPGGGVAASGVGGVADGEVFRFTFDVTGPHPSVAVSKGRVSLVSAASLWIEDWEIADDAYYAR
jgi:hypothetical protein